jgi:hypothetical protein
LNLSPEEANRVTELRRKVKESLDKEQRTYARPVTHDDLIVRLYPPMREAVSMPFGTWTALKEKIDARQAAEREKAAEIARIEAEKEAVIRREAQLAQARRQKDLNEQAERWRKIDALLMTERVSNWKPDTSASTIETVLRLFSVVRLTGNYTRSGMDVEVLLRSAWKARERRHPFRSWLSEQSIQDTARAKMVLEALRTAGLIS